jgi:hypothetical protein
MESAAETQQAGIGQFFNPGVLFNKLIQEFDRLDVEWNNTPDSDGNLVRKAPVLSEDNYVVDLQKAKQVVKVLDEVLGSYFEVPLFEVDGVKVVEVHPVFQQLRALSVALNYVSESKFATNFPYSLTKQGQKLTCVQKLHLKQLIGLVDLIERDTNTWRDAENKEKGYKVHPRCTIQEACEILCKNVSVRFKEAPVDAKKLLQLYYNH